MTMPRIFLALMLFAIVFPRCSSSNADQWTADSLQQHCRDSLASALRMDTLNMLLHLSDSFSSKCRYDTALKLCELVLKKDSLFARAYVQKGTTYQRQAKHKEAIYAYSSAIHADRSNGKAWYERAVCYSHQKQKPEAVFDLKQAIQLKYPSADSLHEKINPLKKRKAGIHSNCCDGTTSPSTGRGACSHHGGVCGTEYDYETYREY